MNSHRPRTTAAERAAWVQRFAGSGLTQRAFAQQHQLGLSTLQKWLTQARCCPGAAPLLWQELPVPMAGGACRWAAELVRPDGLTLRLAPDSPAELVNRLWQLPRW